VCAYRRIYIFFKGEGGVEDFEVGRGVIRMYISITGQQKVANPIDFSFQKFLTSSLFLSPFDMSKSYFRGREHLF
jgi:hypothetical protein